MRAARSALREIEANDDIPGLHIIKDKLLTLIADDKRTTASLVEDRLNPKGLIYLLITNVAYAELGTGRYHVYRGVLSMSGQQLLSAFIFSSERMIEHGVHDRVSHEFDLADLRKELSQIG